MAKKKMINSHNLGRAIARKVRTLPQTPTMISTDDLFLLDSETQLRELQAQMEQTLPKSVRRTTSTKMAARAM